jgi:hypothetical protein
MQGYRFRHATLAFAVLSMGVCVMSVEAFVQTAVQATKFQSPPIVRYNTRRSSASASSIGRQAWQTPPVCTCQVSHVIPHVSQTHPNAGGSISAHHAVPEPHLLSGLRRTGRGDDSGKGAQPVDVLQ